MSFDYLIKLKCSKHCFYEYCLYVSVLRIVASLEAEASALSSVASSQDSLHKQPKKKGIKSSIGRLFGKKEKGRLAHLAHRQVMVDPQGEYSAGIFYLILLQFGLFCLKKTFKKSTLTIQRWENTKDWRLPNCI